MKSSVSRRKEMRLFRIFGIPRLARCDRLTKHCGSGDPDVDRRESGKSPGSVVCGIAQGHNGSIQIAQLDVAEIDLGRLDLERDPALGDRPGRARLLRVDEANARPLVDHVAVEDVDRGVAARDDLDRVPAVDLEFARQVLLVSDAPPAEDTCLAALLLDLGRSASSRRGSWGRSRCRAGRRTARSGRPRWSARSGTEARAARSRPGRSCGNTGRRRASA